jgi:recombination protein RecT
MPPRNQARKTVRQSAEGGQQAGLSRNQLDESVRDAVPYFRRIVPAHMNADQYAAIVIGLLHKDLDLADTAMRNQPSFMAALADCARLGLVPGDGYALWPLHKGKANAAVLGDTTYTGEIELMYRSGGVASITAEIVREADHYVPGRHAHEPPEFRRLPNDWASDEERGERLGAFCYCILDTGAVSRVVRMGAGEIMKHKAAARGSESEWSPWNGDFEDSMWLKTTVHEQFKWVPHSAEYRRDLMRATAELAGTPIGALPLQPAHEFGSARDRVTLIPPAPPAPRAISNGPGSQQQPQRRQGRDQLDNLPALFDALNVDSDAERRRIAQALLPDWNGRRGLTDDETASVKDTLTAVLASEDPAAELARLAPAGSPAAE